MAAPFVERDPKTGQAFLRLPMPGDDVLRKIADIFGAYNGTTVDWGCERAMNPRASARTPSSAASALANTLGGIAFLIALAVYAHAYILKPLYPAWLGRDAIYLFRGSFVPGTPVEGILTGNDFAHIYFGSWLLWQGGNPYDPEALFNMAQGQRLNPYVYLPFTGLIMGPDCGVRLSAERLPGVVPRKSRYDLARRVLFARGGRDGRFPAQRRFSPRWSLAISRALVFAA